MRIRVTLCVLAAAVGCGGPSFTTGPTIAPNPNPAVPQAAVVKFAASGLVETTLAISTGEHSWQLSYDSSKDPSAGLPVIGLYPAAEHEVTVTIRDESGVNRALGRSRLRHRRFRTAAKTSRRSTSP